LELAFNPLHNSSIRHGRIIVTNRQPASTSL